MIYGSVCSGIEAASVAWHPLGWRASFLSEIEPFPRAVLQHHYPDVPLHGDFTTIGDEYEPIDLLVGGTPCQSFSVAGLRGGLGDDRGNLALEFLRLADRTRPRWVVWENVPGVLSSNGGRDFGSILGGLVECGYGWAYRVLDAQYVRVDSHPRAVPQRRRRVFVVGYLGDWRRAGAVLFERESLQGHPAPRREAGEGAAPTLSARTKGGGGLGTDFDCDGGLVTGALTVGKGAPGTNGQDAHEGFILAFGGNNTSGPIDVATACNAHCGRQDFESETLIAFNHQPGGDFRPMIQEDVANALQRGQGQAVLAPTIEAGYGVSHGNAPQTRSRVLLSGVRKALGEEAFCEWGLGVAAALFPQEVLQSALHGCELRPATFSRSWLVNCALSREKGQAEGALQSLREAKRLGCTSQGREPSEQLAKELGAYLSELSQPGPQPQRFVQDMWEAAEGIGVLRKALSALQEARRPTCSKDKPTYPYHQVRRLTVEECEFLMGFPRNYTAVPYRGKPAADGPRHKALGNSMAVNVMSWIGQRIAMVETNNPATNDGVAGRPPKRLR